MSYRASHFDCLEAFKWVAASLPKRPIEESSYAAGVVAKVEALEAEGYLDEEGVGPGSTGRIDATTKPVDPVRFARAEALKGRLPKNVPEGHCAICTQEIGEGGRKYCSRECSNASYGTYRRNAYVRTGR